jgi:hypothetical protein
LEASFSLPRSWDSLFRALFRSPIEPGFRHVLPLLHFLAKPHGLGHGAPAVFSRRPAVPHAPRPVTAWVGPFALLSLPPLRSPPLNHRKSTFLFRSLPALPVSAFEKAEKWSFKVCSSSGTVFPSFRRVPTCLAFLTDCPLPSFKRGATRGLFFQLRGSMILQSSSASS